MPEECICTKGKESEEGTIPFDRDPNCPVHGDSSEWFKGKKLMELYHEGLKRVAEAMTNPPRCGGQDYINGIPVLPCGSRFHPKDEKEKIKDIEKEQDSIN
jgi:hypothetical protein